MADAKETAKEAEIRLLTARRDSLQATMDKNKARFDAVDRIPTIGQEQKAIDGINSLLAELNPPAPATPPPAPSH